MTVEEIMRVVDELNDEERQRLRQLLDQRPEKRARLHQKNGRGNSMQRLTRLAMA